MLLGAGWRLKALRRGLRDNRRLRAADGVIVSFPKSGRTWVRVMLSRLVARRFGLPEGALIDFDNFARLSSGAPRLLFTHDDDAMTPPERLVADKSRYSGRPVVFIARHPGDVVVSRYFHLKFRSKDAARRRLATRPLDDFVWTETGGVPTVVAYLNNWAEAARRNGGILTARYEDFREDPVLELGRLARHLGLPDDAHSIDEAVAYAAFERMRAREASGVSADPRLTAGLQGDERSFKTRRGEVGGWRSTLSPEVAQRVEDYVAARLDPSFGYARGR